VSKVNTLTHTSQKVSIHSSPARLLAAIPVISLYIQAIYKSSACQISECISFDKKRWTILLWQMNNLTTFAGIPSYSNRHYQLSTCFTLDADEQINA
jgi:hypothetical protein